MSDFVMTLENDTKFDSVRPGARLSTKDVPVEDPHSSDSDSSESEDDDSSAETDPSAFNFDNDSDDEAAEKDWYENAQTTSWDFKGAISKINKEEANKHGQKNMSSVDDKIKKIREKRKQQEKQNQSSSDSDDNDTVEEDSADEEEEADHIENETSARNNSNSESDADEDEDANKTTPSSEDDVSSEDEQDEQDEQESRRNAVRGHTKKSSSSNSFFDDEDSARREAEAARIDAVGSRKKKKKTNKNSKEDEEQEEDATSSITFDALNLSRPLLRATHVLGFKKPTPIQCRAIPLALAGRDLCCNAMTGSGKTAAFLLPVLERLLHRPKNQHVTRVLIVTPTRELATQCLAMFSALGQFTDIRSCLVVGGLSLQAQETDLRTRPDVVVCTPGRMIDLVR